MKLPFYIVDVFAENKYAGNQLAVFENSKDEKLGIVSCYVNIRDNNGNLISRHKRNYKEKSTYFYVT